MSRVLRILWRWSLVLILVVGVAAGCEDLLLRYRMSRGAASAVVDHVTTYDAAELKGGRVEIYFDHPEIQECVHALFPHLGDPPCWYVKRHPIKLISQWILSGTRTVAIISAIPVTGEPAAVSPRAVRSLK